MSPSLLSQRLKALQEYGVVERRRLETGRGSEYHLTPAGNELKPIVLSFGEWGQRWIRSQIHEADLDAGLLMWDMRRTIDAEAFPPERTAIAFEYSDAPGKERHWWLVVQDGESELCWEDPGIPIDLYIFTDLHTMTQIWMGDISISEAQRRDLIELQGSREIIRAMPRWFTRSLFATVPRPPSAAYVAMC